MQERNELELCKRVLTIRAYVKAGLWDNVWEQYIQTKKQRKLIKGMPKIKAVAIRNYIELPLIAKLQVPHIEV